MKKIISILISMLIIIITIIGLYSNLSFEDWIPIDVILIILLIINSMISYSKDNDGIANINLVLPFIMVGAYFMHLSMIFWIIIDCAIIVGSIYSIYKVIVLKRK